MHAATQGKHIGAVHSAIREATRGRKLAAGSMAGRSPAMSNCPQRGSEGAPLGLLELPLMAAPWSGHQVPDRAITLKFTPG